MLLTFPIPALGVLSSEIIAEFGLTRAGFGWLISAMAMTIAVTSPAGGRLVDRFGARSMMLLGVAAVVVLTGWMAAATTIAMFAFVAALTGPVNSMGNPGTNLMIGLLLPHGRRGLAVGLKQSGVQLGFFATGVLLPLGTQAWGWRGALWATAGVVTVLGLLCHWALPALDRPSRPAPGTHRPGGRYRSPAPVRWLALYAVLMGAGGACVSSFLPLFGIEVLGLRPAQAGATLSVVGITGVLSRIALANRSEGVAHHGVPLSIISLGAVAAIGLLLAAMQVQWLVWLGATLAGVTIAAWSGISNLAVLSTGPLSEAGRASGLLNRGLMAGYALAPPVFGVLVDRSGSYLVSWLVVGAVFASAGLLMLLWRRRDGVNVERPHGVS